jgi:peptide-methionine (S)-S-oxide reductase
MQTQTIVFGGGCFWCVEAIFQQLRGVASVVSGYAGGEMPNPTYDKICNGNTGHAEVIKIDFDVEQLSLHDLLSIFFEAHDPTTRNKQGNDVGEQYRSIVLYSTDEQKQEVEKYIAELTASGKFDKPIVTQVVPLEKFYSAEEYHQNYYNRNSEQPYCSVVIGPKLEKLRHKFAHLLK